MRVRKRLVVSKMSNQPLTTVDGSAGGLEDKQVFENERKI